ncbi:MAG: 30S ribosomal protein S8 [Candidatus Firestonebacteria bacterium]
MDIISDMLTNIRNASNAFKEMVDVRDSWFSFEISKILQKEGYIKNFKRIGSKIRIHLKYLNREKAITGLKRVSTPGLRIYRKSKKIPRVLDGYGVAIVSTSKGIMTDKEARMQNAGGEVICYIW